MLLRITRRFSAIPFTRKKAYVEPINQIKIESIEFEGRAMLDRIEKAMRPMQPLNETMEFTRLQNELHVNTGVKGWFIFRIDLKTQSLVMSSPQSGTFSYKFCHSSREWLDESDNHDLRGMLTRDLLRVYVGCPQF
jgi:frataxin-like iron-binding protein CyaY